MTFENTLDFARELDAKDSLAAYRKEFIFPKVNDREVIYFTGNSLGLQPRRSKAFVEEIMQDWADLGVEGHFQAEKPWWDYHERLAAPLAKVVGALEEEVTVMNTLTVNLHLLMVSFYRPNPGKFKILCEEKAFPSDQYMLQSQARFHGYAPEEAIIEVKKRSGEHHWHTEDFLKAIEDHKDELALVLLGGVNYYNGQVLDMARITAKARAYNIPIGWDLAHAAGNIELKLHEWDVDFAAWCSYKYMNSGPGNLSGIFVNKRYHNSRDIPRFEGWWGTKKDSRFLMKPEFEPMPNAEAWQMSNLPVMAIAPYLASLTMFEEVGMERLTAKSRVLTSYLEFVLQSVASETGGNFEVITPDDRGCQLSVLLHGEGRALFDFLMAEGVVPDWREPNVIRLAPVPFYNSFEDMFRFGQILKQGILKK